MTVTTLKPLRKDFVFDLVQQAGLDVEQWVASSNDARGPRANPKYCYEWAFIEPGKVAILNLWYQNFEELPDGRIIQRHNFREDYERLRAGNGKPQWIKRAATREAILQRALRDNLAIRVIVNDGVIRDRADTRGVASKVEARQLDPLPWTIIEYDAATGAHTLARGILQQPYIDQFMLSQAIDAEGTPTRINRRVTMFARNPKVRFDALARAAGHCQLCSAEGFQMKDGGRYLETHHVVPLAEGGADHISNVIALCPNDHRKAHHGIDAQAMRKTLTNILAHADQPKAPGARGRTRTGTP